MGRMSDLLSQLFAIEQDFEVDLIKQRAGLEMLLQSDRAQAFIAETAGEVIAMATLQIVVSTGEGGLVGWVEDVAVDRAHRGKGVGRRLLDHLQQWSDSQGLSRLQLAADRGNRPALDFYHRNGWSETNLMVLRRAQTHGI